MAATTSKKVHTKQTLLARFTSALKLLAWVVCVASVYKETGPVTALTLGALLAYTSVVAVSFEKLLATTQIAIRQLEELHNAVTGRNCCDEGRGYPNTAQGPLKEPTRTVFDMLEAARTTRVRPPAQKED